MTSSLRRLYFLFSVVPPGSLLPPSPFKTLLRAYSFSEVLPLLPVYPGYSFILFPSDNLPSMSLICDIVHPLNPPLNIH